MHGVPVHGSVCHEDETQLERQENRVGMEVIFFDNPMSFPVQRPRIPGCF